jgi:hypothetical protein
MRNPTAHIAEPVMASECVHSASGDQQADAHHDKHPWRGALEPAENTGIARTIV